MQLHYIGHVIHAAMWSWHDAKMFIEQSIDFSSDALHVFVGVIIQLSAAFVLKRPISDWRLWFVVLMLISLNEFIDLQVEHWPKRTMQYGESAKDLILTLVLPTILLFTARYRPSLFSWR